MVSELLLDGSGTEVFYDTGVAGRLFMIQNNSGGVCFVSVGASSAEVASEPYTTGVRLALGEKLTVLTKEDKTFIRTIDNGASGTVRVFALT